MDEEDFSSLPLSDRAVHRVWKVRLNAYEEMKKQFSSSGSEADACFKPFLENPNIYKKIVTDSNVVAQEAGINSLSAFIEFGGSNACLRTRSVVVGSLIEKGLSSGRQGTRQSSIDVLMWYIEMDIPDPVIDELVPFLTHRMPKLVAAVVAALVAIFKDFGPKTVSPKPLMKAIPKLFSHADKNVRAEATNLVVELYKWLGQGISTLILPELKPVQQKELEDLFAKFDASGESPKQTRFIKSQKEAMERQQANGIRRDDSSAKAEYDNMTDDQPVDPLDLIEAVSILPKIPANLPEQITSTKWKDRKEAIEELVVVLKSAPKIVNDDFTDIIRLLAKCIQKDANIQVVALAANSIEILANGLRQAFSRYESFVLAPLLERTKEKKTSVADALGSALDSTYKSTNLSSILETIVEYLKHKTPQVKIESSKFLIRCLKTTPTIPNPPEIKLIIESSIKLLNDTQEPVRTGGAEILGVMMKIIGERGMNPFMENIDDIKKGKIKEFYESSIVVAKQVVKPPAPPSQTAASSTAAPRQSKPAARPVQGMRSTPAKPPPAARRRLISPVKAPPLSGNSSTTSLSSNSSSAFDDQAHQTSRPGLTNRVLNSRQQPKQQLSSSTPAIPDARLVELDQLRNERSEFAREIEQLKWKSQEDQAEKNRLMQELSEAQRKIAEHIEKQTNETLRTKSLETQLTRAHSDLETYRSRNNKLEMELERVKLMAARQQEHQSSSSPPAAAPPQQQPHQQYYQQQPQSQSQSQLLLTQPHLQSPPPLSSPQFTASEPNLTTSSVLRSLSTGRSTGPPSNHKRGTSSPKSPAMTLQFGLDTRSSSTSSSSTYSIPNSRSQSQSQSHHGANSGLRRSIDFTNLDDGPSTFQQRRLGEKENGGMSSYRHLHTRSITEHMMSEDAEMVDAPPSPSRIPTAVNSTVPPPTTNGTENWRRAAAVTSELRARIEAMRRARAVV